jgi:hypothetical protein
MNGRPNVKVLRVNRNLIDYTLYHGAVDDRSTENIRFNTDE